MAIKSIIFLVIIVLATSRLILPDEMDRLEIEQAKYMNPHLSSQAAPTRGSYAKPVEGIANATSGYLSVEDPDNNSKLFYIFYSCRGLKPGQSSTEVPIIIWLQGGPGGTSQLGNFFEFGPYTIVEEHGKAKEKRVEKSWNDHYNLLILDNPRGTGYSIADKDSYVESEDEVAEDFLHAMLNFYKLDAFKQYAKTPLYIFGESYAGHYIPSVAKRIIEYDANGPEFRIPLAGLGIGDGFTDPEHQMAENALFAFSLGLVDDVQRARIEAAQLSAVHNIYKKDWSAAKSDFSVIMGGITRGGGGLNVYNFREFGNYDFSRLLRFMNDADTVKRYNVDPSVAGRFSDINRNVYNALNDDFMASVADRVTFVAESGLPIMFFNGQDDIICNAPSVQNFITNLKWSGQNALYDTDFNVWVYQNGTIAGLQKNVKNFYFVIVNKAGHLAPMDQIDTTTEMVHRFIALETNWTKPAGSKKNVLLNEL